MHLASRGQISQSWI